jgi:hypothetical protein
MPLLVPGANSRVSVYITPANGSSRSIVTVLVLSLTLTTKQDTLSLSGETSTGGVKIDESA